MSTSLPRGQTKAKILPLFRLSLEMGLRLSLGKGSNLPGGNRGPLWPPIGCQAARSCEVKASADDRLAGGVDATSGKISRSSFDRADGVVVQLQLNFFDFNDHPVSLAIRSLARLFLVPEPPLLSRTGNRSLATLAVNSHFDFRLPG